MHSFNHSPLGTIEIVPLIIRVTVAIQYYLSMKTKA